jgi:hypothetical protein
VSFEQLGALEINKKAHLMVGLFACGVLWDGQLTLLLM